MGAYFKYQVRPYIEFNTEENKAVRDRLSVFSMAQIKVLDHIIYTTFKTALEILCSVFFSGHFISWTIVFLNNSKTASFSFMSKMK